MLVRTAQGRGLKAPTSTSPTLLGKGPASNPRPQTAAVQTPRQLHPISGRTLGGSPAAPAAPTTWPLSARRPNRARRVVRAGPPGSALGHAARAAPHPLRRPAVGGPGRGGPIGAPVAIVGGGPEPLPRAARKSAARNRAQGPRARGSGRAAAVAGGPPPAGGRRAEGGGIRGAGGGGGAAGATPRRERARRGQLRGRRRGLGKDTCCTVLWMVVSGDWDSFSSCRIC